MATRSRADPFRHRSLRPDDPLHPETLQIARIVRVGIVHYGPRDGRRAYCGSVARPMYGKVIRGVCRRCEAAYRDAVGGLAL
jgi:hypothetical protein